MYPLYCVCWGALVWRSSCTATSDKVCGGTLLNLKVSTAWRHRNTGAVNQDTWVRAVDFLATRQSTKMSVICNININNIQFCSVLYKVFKIKLTDLMAVMMYLVDAETVEHTLINVSQTLNIVLIWSKMVTN